MQTIATLAADPVASLVDTAFIGHLGQFGLVPAWTHLHPEPKQLASRNFHASVGAVQLAGVGIALSVYSTVTKLFNVPLLSVATSSVATAYGEHEGKHPYLPEVSAHLSAVDVSVQNMPLPCTQLCTPRWFEGRSTWCRFTQGSLRSCISSVAPCCHCWRL